MKKHPPRKNAAGPAAAPGPDRNLRGLVGGVFALAGILLLAVLIQSGTSGTPPEMAGKPWASFAPVIARNKLLALVHASAMTALLGAALLRLAGIVEKPVWLRPVRVAWMLVLLVAADTLWLSRHYIATTPRAGLAENEVLRALKQTAPHGRVAMGTREGFYNLWLTYLFPYHGVSAFDMTQMPRMPADYRQFLGAVGSDPYRLWRLCGVEALVLPQGAWTGLQRDPRWRGRVEPVFFFDVQPHETYVTVQPAPMGQMAAHGVFRLGPGPARFVLAYDWRTVTPEEALTALAAPGFVPLRSVLVTGAAPPPPAAAPAASGVVEVVSYRQGAVQLRVDTGAPAILRLADRFDPNWTARVDDAPAELLRVDYLFQGIYLAPGNHRVELRYRAPLTGLWVQLAGTSVALLGGLALLWPRRSQRSGAAATPNPEGDAK